ncbi:MAG: hypothetical protein JNM52_01425, partial [Betaproteobacteria bacterium]|nr:hypothetical protein [Betaproteobacteria bacterium]
MKALWLKYAAKIDALNLRERALLFATIVLILGSLADTLAINPLLNEQKKLTAQIEAQAAETRQIRE